MMTPAQKAERARKNLLHNQAADRVTSRHKRQADLAVANGHADLSPQHMAGPQHMTARPIVVPNRIDALHAGAQSLGKGDAAAKPSNAGIESRLDKLITNTESMFKNKK